MAKHEIWLSESAWGLRRAANDWEICTAHYSKSAALKAARKCQKASGIKHRVRKQT